MFGAIIGIILGIWDAVGAVALAIWEAVKSAWGFISPIFDPFIKFGEVVWQDILAPVVSTVESAFKTIAGWFASVFGPVKDFLKTIYQAERAIYTTFFQPVLQTISALETFLNVTGLAHTAIGAAIEAALGDVYGAVNGLYQHLVQPINQVINTIESYILDAQNLINAPLLLESIGKNIAAIWTLWWAQGIQPLTAAGHHFLAYFGEQHTIADAHGSLVAYLQTGSGPYQPHIDGALETLRLAMQLEEPPGLPPTTPELQS